MCVRACVSERESVCVCASECVCMCVCVFEKRPLMGSTAWWLTWCTGVNKI